MKAKIFLVLALLTSQAYAQNPNYVGYKHKGVVYGEILPNGVKDLGGGLLSNENYGVSRFSKGGKYMLWLEKIAARDGDGVPRWEVLDVLNFGKLKKHQEFSVSHSSICRQDGKINLEIIVMTEFQPKTKTYKAVRAWRANVKKGRFEKISNKSITCVAAEK